MSKSVARVLLSFVVLASAFPAVAAPARRRAVKAPSGTSESVIFGGTVTDATTGQPVVGAEVAGGGRTGTTGADGKYQIQLPSGASVTMFAKRSGYESSAAREISPAAGLAVNFTLKSKPTITLRENSGTVRTLDGDSAEWAYELVFTGVVRTKETKFCKADGSSVSVKIDQVARITGPVTSSTLSCCSTGPLTGVTVTLKSGETSQLFFQDSCFGYTVVFVAREHAKSQFVYLRYSDIAEIVFP